ncbi:aquaporin [Agromyces sp. CCNWLW203]|uniref:aquaporin n=1 Tax=Agromyces sp. CCNWLW203 TaxID=3112842 RepID=UPI003FA5C4EA
MMQGIDSRALAGEFVGSGLLATVVVGSGIAAQRLSPTDTGLQLLENAVATTLGLGVLIMIFAPLSGAQFNPIVSLVDAALGGRPWRDLIGYLPAQFAGCVAGVALANLMYDLPAVQSSTTERITPGHLLSEVVATAGLVVLIFALVRTGRARAVAPAVGAYIGAAYFFTSSSSFANPAITVARMFTDTFAGIAPTSVPGFMVAQVIGGCLGWAVVLWLFPRSAHEDAAHPRASAPDVTARDDVDLAPAPR